MSQAAVSPSPSGDRVPDPARGRIGVPDLIAEPGLFLGSGSAVMLQLAIWGVGKGVAQHSNTMERPLDRLRTTTSYLFALGMGTDDEIKEIARQVNRAHVPIRGEGYTAFDPDLQLWVASTLIEVARQMYEKIFGPLDPDSLERCYQESWIYGTALQVKPEMWPPTRAEFDAYWASMEEQFRSDPEIRRYAHALITPGDNKWYLRLGMPFVSLMTRGNLSPQAREALDFDWTPRDQRRYDAVWRVVRVVYPRIPKFVRRIPSQIAMRDIRRRLESGRRVI